MTAFLRDQKDILAMEVASIGVATAVSCAQDGWAGLAVGALLASLSYGKQYLPSLSFNFNKNSQKKTEPIPQHITESLEQAKAHLGYEEDVTIRLAPGEKLGAEAIGNQILFGKKASEKLSEGTMAFVVGHELSHIHNGDDFRRAGMVMPMMVPLAVWANMSGNPETASAGLMVATGAYTIAQVLAFFNHCQRVEQRCDQDGLNIAKNFEDVVRGIVSVKPKKYLRKDVPTVKKLLTMHPQGWERFEKLERNHFGRQETPLSDALYPQLCAEHQIG